MSVDLQGRVALVTGASSGLGRRFAEVLAQAGASVVVAGRRKERLEALAKEINGAGGRAYACVLDVRDADSVKAAVAFVEAKCGPLDTLVNAAGVSDGAYVTKLSLETIDNVIDTNFRGLFLMCVEAGRRMIERNVAGRIVNISSMGAHHYAPKSSAALYSATKSAVSRLTETLAVEWAQFGINVNAIAPGFFHSEMSEAFLDRVGDQIRQQFPRKRFGQPRDLDGTLLYLVSSASDFVTGTCILVDDAQMPR